MIRDEALSKVWFGFKRPCFRPPRVGHCGALNRSGGEGGDVIGGIERAGGRKRDVPSVW